MDLNFRRLAKSSTVAGKLFQILTTRFPKKVLSNIYTTLAYLLTCPRLVSFGMTRKKDRNAELTTCQFLHFCLSPCRQADQHHDQSNVKLYAHAQTYAPFEPIDPQYLQNRGIHVPCLNCSVKRGGSLLKVSQSRHWRIQTPQLGV